ncbi:MAG: YbaB/EbfC family nucleoid-associated protein [Bacteroidota bacterium]
MLGNMMEQLQQMKQKMEETKKRLDTVSVEGVSANGKIKIEMTGNRKVKNISIAEDLQISDKEEMEDLLIIAFNHALEQADKINETEMQSAAMGFLPGM